MSQTALNRAWFRLAATIVFGWLIQLPAALYAAGPGVHGRVFALDESGELAGVVAGAQIEIKDASGAVAARTTTENDGYYKVDLSPRNYTYTVKAAGYLDEDEGRGMQLQLSKGYATYNFSLIRGDKSLDPPARPDAPPDARPDAPPVIDKFKLRVEVVPQGDVKILQQGTPVAGGKASVDAQLIKELSPGDYLVYAENAGFHPLATEVTIGDADVNCQLLLTRIESSRDPLPDENRPDDDDPRTQQQKLSLVLQVVRVTPGRVDGAAPAYEPLDGARVQILLGETPVASGISGEVPAGRLDELRRMKITQKAGIFASGELPVIGGYFALIRKEGFHPAEKAIPIQQRGPHIVVLRPLESEEPEPPPTKQAATVRVRVVDRLNGSPLDSVRVTIGLGERNERPGKPEGGGMYAFQLARENYWIEVGREGYREYHSPFDLREKLEPRYTVKLDRLPGSPPPKEVPPDEAPKEAKLLVRVRDASQRGRPGIAGADVIVKWAGRQVARGQTRRDGVADFHVSRGDSDYEVIVHRDSFVPAPARRGVQIRRGFGECVIDLTPVGAPPVTPPGKKEATLRVRVVDASKRERPGIGGARVVVQWGGRPVAQGRTDRSGTVNLRLTPNSFELEKYAVEVQAEDFVPRPARAGAEVRRGFGERVVELRPEGAPPGGGATLIVSVQGLDLNAPISTLHPLGGAQVVVRGGGRQWKGRTSDNGTWRVKLPPGRYRIDATHATAQRPASAEATVGQQGEVRAGPLVVKYRTPR